MNGTGHRRRIHPRNPFIVRFDERAVGFLGGFLVPSTAPTQIVSFGRCGSETRAGFLLYALSAARSSSRVAALFKLSTPKTTIPSVEPGSSPK
jgi:hypothetical protein